MSCSLKPLRGAIQEIIPGSNIGVIKGGTRGLDYSSNSSSNYYQ